MVEEIGVCMVRVSFKAWLGELLVAAVSSRIGNFPKKFSFSSRLRNCSYKIQKMN